MRKKRLLWQLYPTYLLITLIALLAVGWYALSSVRQFYLARTTADLEARASLIRHQIINVFSKGSGPALGPPCELLGDNPSYRITLISPDGKVTCDSEKDAALMDNHADRSEFKQALAGQTGIATRFSHTLGKKMLYIAIPIADNGRTIGVARASVPITFIDQALRAIQLQIAIGGLVIAILAAAICWFVSRRISLPLEAIRKGAEQFARGALGHKVPVPPSVEIGGVADALNEMAAQLNDKIQTITTQRNEKEAVLSSMVEGVLAVDTQERIISLNKAAAQLLEVHPGKYQGRYVQDAVRNVDLQEFISKVLSSGEPIDEDIALSYANERFLQVQGTVLRNAQNQSIGALVVLNDVTRLRRLENTRRDFVANVSHELKTPITSIKGFVETLLGGAIDDPQKAKPFLEIVSKQADRLNAIIEDLLSLSRIEQGSEKSQIPLEEVYVKDVLKNVAQVCHSSAEGKSIKIRLVCENRLKAKVNPPLLEQAVTNLVDNALKYSEPGGSVQAKAEKLDRGIKIHIQDWGCGIGPEHLPRLFERFYRVDRARSRKLGGTGLGLAIVKHIAQAHGGSVSVDSAPQKGSVFSICLPEA
ncbi:MAG: two-component system histidine kinase PnpS [Nitrospinales bacterium]